MIERVSARFDTVRGRKPGREDEKRNKPGDLPSAANQEPGNARQPVVGKSGTERLEKTEPRVRRRVRGGCARGW